MRVIIKGLTTPPVNVANLEVVALNGTAMLTWDLATDFDVKENGSVQFRYSPLLTGAVWENALKMKNFSSGANTTITLPLLIGTYLAKFSDSANNESVNATEVIVSKIANAVHMNTIVSSLNQHPDFSGTKTNMIVTNDLLQFDVDGVDLYQFGVYEFDNLIDVGSVQNVRAIIGMTINAVDLNDLIDDRDFVDTWQSIDNPPANVVVEAFISMTDDNPISSPTWTPWRAFSVGDYTARAFKFKIEATSQNLNHQIYISELSASFEMPDRSEIGRQITSGTTTKTITYVKPFIDEPVITITPINMMAGDYFTIPRESLTDFDINFYDTNDSSISRIFNYNSIGF